jgi:hypothetical protein
VKPRFTLGYSLAGGLDALSEVARMSPFGQKATSVRPCGMCVPLQERTCA